VWVLGSGHSWDLYVGSNNVNAFVGILLKRVGIVKKVVYYVIDFNPNRFDQPLINFLYQKLDQYCVRESDETWNMSPRMEEGRKDYFGFIGGNQKVVPVGLWLSESVSLPLDKISRHTLAFVGHVQEKQGAQYIIRAIPAIVKKIPDFTFLVIGGGDYVPALEALARRLQVASHVRFTGYLNNHTEIDALLSKSALGVALYDSYDGKNVSFSYFGNPTKVKTYFSAGLPVLISDVPYNAREIEKAGCGKIISYDANDISHAVITILSSAKTLAGYRDHVRVYRKKFDWNSIFSDALKNLL
jgi:glycosyltransferase involved in cell wall biosynthesis